MDNKLNLKNSFCNNFFKFFDYFGVNFTFKIKNERYYKTSFGGKIFLLFLIVSSVYFINLFVKFCKRTTFSINNSMLVKSPAPKINFKESTHLWVEGRWGRRGGGIKGGEGRGGASCEE